MHRPCTTPPSARQRPHLTIVVPAKHQTAKDFVSKYVSCAQHLLAGSSRLLISGAPASTCMAPAAPPGGSWPVLSPSWSRRRGGSADERTSQQQLQQELGRGVAETNEQLPPSLQAGRPRTAVAATQNPPNQNQYHSHTWNIPRRAVSNSSSTSGAERCSPSSPSSSSPVSPISMWRRSARLSGFMAMRRHHSTAGTPQSPAQHQQPHFQNPTLQHPPSSNSHLLPLSQDAPLQPVFAPSLVTSYQLANPSLSGTHSAPYSPIAGNPYDSWQAPTAQVTTVATTTTSSLAPPPLLTTTSLPPPTATRRLLSSPIPQVQAPALTTIPPKTNDPEPDFTSPSEIALFVEATSSLSILPSPTFHASPVNTQIPTLSTPNPSNNLTATAPALHHTARASSVPAPSHRNHSNPLPSTSATNLALPTGPSALHAAPSLTHSRTGPTHSAPHPPGYALPARPSSYTFPTASISSSATPGPPPLRTSRSEMLAAALASDYYVCGPRASAGDDDAADLFGAPDDEDDELPDYATSQAEAAARQRDEAARRARELEEGWRRGRAERAREGVVRGPGRGGVRGVGGWRG